MSRCARAALSVVSLVLLGCSGQPAMHHQTAGTESTQPMLLDGLTLSASRF